MSDFFTRLGQRALGNLATVRPASRPLFASDPANRERILSNETPSSTITDGDREAPMFSGRTGGHRLTLSGSHPMPSYPIDEPQTEHPSAVPSSSPLGLEPTESPSDRQSGRSRMGLATANGKTVDLQPDDPRELVENAGARARAMARTRRERALVVPGVCVPLTPDAGASEAPLNEKPSGDSALGQRPIPDARPPGPAIPLEKPNRASEFPRERYGGPAAPSVSVCARGTTIERTSYSLSREDPVLPKQPEALAVEPGAQPQPVSPIERLVPFEGLPFEAAGLRAARRREASRETAEAEPTITVHIGRVEVQSSFPEPAPVARVASRRRGPALSLSEYLKQRNGGTR
jgi:hypothetical protein